MKAEDVDELTHEALIHRMIILINWLDELDMDDTFGTEGWRHAIGWD